MIEVQSLHYSIGTAKILQDVTLSLREGGVTALIGPNGAGKSTLLHCIAGLNRPSGGAVRIGELDPLAAPALERARVVSLLQQSPAVVSRLRVRELVAFGRWPHHKGRPGPEDDAKVAAAIETFALAEIASRPLDTLSGGQRQRAFVAMTYAQDAPWMLLDEPLNALDPRHARDLMATLQDLARVHGRSVVVVLHDLNTAARWADRIVAMKGGRVVAHAPAPELLTPEVLADVFETPFDVLAHDGRPVVVTG